MGLFDTGKIPPTAGGFAHGVGLFETCAIDKRRIAFFDEHWDRLTKSASALGLPFEFNKEETRTSLTSYLQSIEETQSSALKLILFESAPKTTQLIWHLRPLRKIEESALQSLNISLQRIDEENELVGHKSLNYWLNRRGMETAAQAGCIDSIVLNVKGHIAECWASNIFFLIDGVFYTPPLKDGPLPGVVRRILLQNASAYGLRIIEKSLRLDDLEQTKSVVVTNSILGLQQIREINLGENRCWKALALDNEAVRNAEKLYFDAYTKSLQSFAL